tara:strand:+ start:30247 stop:30795 length:549 start_codon:yes stop_codon:yes gene_type:complete
MTDDPYAAFKDDGIPGNLEIVLMQLADELEAADALIAIAEEALEKAKDARKDIAEVRIPAATEGMNGKLVLKDGRTLEVKEDIRSSIAGDKRIPAIAWLDANDYGHIVKRQLVFSFAKGDDKGFKAFEDTIKKLKMPLVMKEEFSVHHATLNAWVKEKLGEGIELPRDTFGIFRQRVAKVKE